ncbi:hypothetical protein FQR65_LT00606 [Abscondita terminalis]|nr:hypothetical protein FQR65_LT00606 [Abscondita terminalis]
MFKFSVLLTILLTFNKETISVKKLNLHILYESLCPYSIKFIQEQLYPVWPEIAPYVNIHFVPFGNSASLEDDVSFTCQHGPQECLGNKIQSCALNGLTDQNAQVEYVNCFMGIYKKSVDKNNTKEMGQIKLHILYESLCPYSIKFIQEQLYPVWPEIAPYVNIHFVPFGNSASLEDGVSFTCQHGPQECLGNKIQSCALNGLNDQNAQVEYVNCFMGTYKKSVDKNNTKEMGQSCAEAVGLPWNYVKSCTKSLVGVKLQLKAEMFTLQHKPKSVPTILFNGHFYQKAQDESQVNFRGVVCSFIEQLNPDACAVTASHTVL